VGEARAIVVSGGSDEDLGLVHQPAKALGVEHAVAVPLKRRPQVALRVREGSECTATRCTGWGEKPLLVLL
jgi:hypothetical protein